MRTKPTAGLEGSSPFCEILVRPQLPQILHRKKPFQPNGDLDADEAEPAAPAECVSPCSCGGPSAELLDWLHDTITDHFYRMQADMSRLNKRIEELEAHGQPLATASSLCLEPEQSTLGKPTSQPIGNTVSVEHINILQAQIDRLGVLLSEQAETTSHQQCTVQEILSRMAVLIQTSHEERQMAAKRLSQERDVLRHQESPATEAIKQPEPAAEDRVTPRTQLQSKKLLPDDDRITERRLYQLRAELEANFEASTHSLRQELIEEVRKSVELGTMAESSAKLCLDDFTRSMKDLTVFRKQVRMELVSIELACLQAFRSTPLYSHKMGARVEELKKEQENLQVWLDQDMRDRRGPRHGEVFAPLPASSDPLSLPEAEPLVARPAGFLQRLLGSSAATR